MKKLVVVALFVGMVIGTLCAPVSAQTVVGRPDPTGKGRYLTFGNETPYSGANVIKTLPSGTACSPAGEMVGIRVWNSTRKGFAVLSELSDKAEIAVAPSGKVFLCHCAGGYNELFVPKTQQPQTTQRVQTQSVPIPSQEGAVTQTQTVTVIVEPSAPQPAVAAPAAYPEPPSYQSEAPGFVGAMIGSTIGAIFAPMVNPSYGGGGYRGGPRYSRGGYAHTGRPVYTGGGHRGGGYRPTPTPARGVGPGARTRGFN